MIAEHIYHAIGTNKYPAPQGTLMATIIKGIQSGNLDWQFILVGVFIAVTLELCSINALSFAVGAYLPLSTTLPIFIGGAIRGIVDAKTARSKKRETLHVNEAAIGEAPAPTQSVEEEDLGNGNLFATGLVAGGAVAGVVVAFLTANENVSTLLARWSAEHGMTKLLGENGYYFLGVLFFALMGIVLYRIAIKKDDVPVIIDKGV